MSRLGKRGQITDDGRLHVHLRLRHLVSGSHVGTDASTCRPNGSAHQRPLDALDDRGRLMQRMLGRLSVRNQPSVTFLNVVN